MSEFEDHIRLPDCVVLYETDKAILVAIPAFGDYWIPKTQIDDRSEVWQDGDVGELWISDWIAQEKGIA